MAVRKLERRNYGGKWPPMSIKYQNLHSFKEGLMISAQNGQFYNTVQKNERNSTSGEWFDQYPNLIKI